MSARERILDGAAEVMRARGLANTTTKEIARASGLSEAMLYKVFHDKVDLFLSVLTERMLGRLTAVLGDQPTEERLPLGGLARLAAEVLSFYLEVFPIAASVFSDPALLTRLRERGACPDKMAESVTAYLAAEQQAGRLAARARPDALAELLVGACLHRAFLVSFAGEKATADDIQTFAQDVVAALEPAFGAP